jgi:GTPase
LQDVRYKRRYLAVDGANGAGARKHGRSGKNLVIRVPVGTQVRRAIEEGQRATGNGQRGDASDALEDEAWELVADLDAPASSFVAAHGGMGGKGNARFTTPTNQAPRIAERGQRGQEARLRLDLKLISDVGIVGLPSVGKSTLISAVSAARPKIAAYPFTTLEPVLGVVEVGYDAFVMADIPGLIEGAHAGVGLGHDFLRHVERTRLLVHLLDGTSEDPLADMDTINRELALFSEELTRKPQIVAINKIDMPEVQERLPDLQQRLAARGIEPLVISAAGGEGTDELVQRVWSELSRLKEASPDMPVDVPETPVLRPEPRPRVTVERHNGVFLVRGRRVEAMAEMLDLSQDEARGEFFRRLQRLGVSAALRRSGAQTGDRVRFGDVEIAWED